jgi:hypothetical protein
MSDKFLWERRSVSLTSWAPRWNSTLSILYQGTWRLHEAVAYMSERGFEISNILPVNYDSSDTVSLVEVDCVFCRRSSKG